MPWDLGFSGRCLGEGLGMTTDVRSSLWLEMMVTRVVSGMEPTTKVNLRSPHGVACEMVTSPSD